MTRAEISDRLRTERERVVVKESQNKTRTDNTYGHGSWSDNLWYWGSKGRRGRCIELSSIAFVSRIFLLYAPGTVSCKNLHFQKSRRPNWTKRMNKHWQLNWGKTGRKQEKKRTIGRGRGRGQRWRRKTEPNPHQLNVRFPKREFFLTSLFTCSLSLSR